MSSQSRREWGVCIYGATGFTGQRVAEYVLTTRRRDDGDDEFDMSVLLVARSALKLAALRDSLQHQHPIAQFETAVADASNHSALVRAFEKCCVVLNCAGPYRYTGLQIARAAVSAGTHYLDLCGEPEFFERVLSSLDTPARERGVLVVSACAFDCVPAELTSALVTAANKNNGNTSNDIEHVRILHRIFISSALGACGFATTWRAAVDGFAAAQRGDLAAARRETKAAGFTEPPRKRTTTRRSNVLQWDGVERIYTLPFPGADAAAVRLSQRYLSARVLSNSHRQWPALTVDAAFQTLRGALQAVFVGFVLSSLSRFRFGAQLLKRFPVLFSLGAFSERGPTDAQLDSTSFETTATAFTHGGLSDSDGKACAVAARARVKGPEPGYRATARIATALVRLVLLRTQPNRPKLGNTESHTTTATLTKHSGESEELRAGVMLPGAAFFASDETRAAAVALLRQEGIQVELEHDPKHGTHS